VVLVVDNKRNEEQAKVAKKERIKRTEKVKANNGGQDRGDGGTDSDAVAEKVQTKMEEMVTEKAKEEIVKERRKRKAPTPRTVPTRAHPRSITPNPKPNPSPAPHRRRKTFGERNREGFDKDDHGREHT
jgi:hypothetical protein